MILCMYIIKKAKLKVKVTENSNVGFVDLSIITDTMPWD